MMTKKAEEKVLTFEEKMNNQVSNLEQQIEQAKATLYQLQGALSASKGLLDEYKTEK